MKRDKHKRVSFNENDLEVWKKEKQNRKSTQEAEAPIILPKLSEAKLNLLRKVFELYDVEKDGLVDKAGLSSCSEIKGGLI